MQVLEKEPVKILTAISTLCHFSRPPLNKIQNVQYADLNQGYTGDDYLSNFSDEDVELLSKNNDVVLVGLTKDDQGRIRSCLMSNEFTIIGYVYINKNRALEVLEVDEFTDDLKEQCREVLEKIVKISYL